MKIGSLFSGIGGLEKGLEDSGLGETVWQVEKNIHCWNILAKHWPNVERFQNVEDVYGTDVMTRPAKLKKLTSAQALECVQMYDSGLSLAPIATYFGVSRQGMHDLLKRRTAMRPQKRFGKDNHFYRGGPKADDPAQNLVETAISQGVLTRRKECEECGKRQQFQDGREGVQAHHDDYNKPLAVRWMCQKCHHDWHKKNQAIAKKGGQELAKVDLICGGFP